MSSFNSAAVNPPSFNSTRVNSATLNSAAVNSATLNSAAVNPAAFNVVAFAPPCFKVEAEDVFSFALAASISICVNPALNNCESVLKPALINCGIL